MMRVALALVVLTLAGCSWVNRTPEFPPYEGIGQTDFKPTQKENLLRRSDFSVEIVRLADTRRPRSIMHQMPDTTIYEYEPDELLQGITARGAVLFNKYLSYRPRTAKHYRVEIDIRQLDTWIATGQLFNGGEWGRYKVVLDVQVLARRPDSMIALNTTYRVELEQPRRTFTGRSPSKEMDRSRMYDLTEQAFRQIAEDIGWNIRQRDARRWSLKSAEATGPVPVQMRPVMPKVDTTPMVLSPTILPEPELQPETDTIDNLSRPDEPLTPDDPSSTLAPSQTQG